jgi:hypothetical protein
MKNFKLILNEKQYHINVIGPLDTYGENEKTHFSEIPLVEISEGNNKSIVYDIRSILDLESELYIGEDKKFLASDNMRKIHDFLFENFSENYLNRFASLPKPKSKIKF